LHTIGCADKKGGKFLCSCNRQKPLQAELHFPSENKEENSSAPAMAVAFSFGKQGGME